MIELDYFQVFYMFISSEIAKVVALVLTGVIIFRRKKWRWLWVWVPLVIAYLVVTYLIFTTDAITTQELHYEIGHCLRAA